MLETLIYPNYRFCVKRWGKIKGTRKTLVATVNLVEILAKQKEGLGGITVSWVEINVNKTMTGEEFVAFIRRLEQEQVE